VTIIASDVGDQVQAMAVRPGHHRTRVRGDVRVARPTHTAHRDLPRQQRREAMEDPVGAGAAVALSHRSVTVGPVPADPEAELEVVASTGTRRRADQGGASHAATYAWP
jgi:hypothetical protein